MAEMVPVDESGRMVIPKRVRERLGIAQGGMLLVEVRGSEVVLKLSETDRSPSKAIGGMKLPIGKWDSIERQIEEGSADVE